MRKWNGPKSRYSILFTLDELDMKTDTSQQMSRVAWAFGVGTFDWRGDTNKASINPFLALQSRVLKSEVIAPLSFALSLASFGSEW